MLKLIGSRFSFATIGIVSGNAKYDQEAARIIEVLKQQSKEPLQFIGVIGDKYADKLHYRFASSFAHDEIDITRNYQQVTYESYFNPIRTLTHLRNRGLLQKLDEDEFHDKLAERKAPAVIVVGNYSLSHRLFAATTKAYEEANQPLPLRIGFNYSIHLRNVANEDFIDYIYYQIPKEPQNLTRYVFPSMCIGYEGLFRAFQYLQKVRGTDSHSFHTTNFSVEVGQIVKKARADFRAAKNFSQDQYLTVLAPGETKKQVDFSFRSFNDSIKKFAQANEIKNVKSDFFQTLILLPEDQKIADYVKQKASGLPNSFQATFIDPKDKYGALCASDFAVLHNGEVTVEAAACQLPAIVINSMSNAHAYVSYLFNGYESPLNVSTGYEAYEQLLGSWTAIGEKIKTSMLSHFQRPKLRYDYVRLYRTEIQRMLSQNGRNPSLDVARTGLERGVEDLLGKIALRDEAISNNLNLRRYDRKERFGLY